MIFNCIFKIKVYEWLFGLKETDKINDFSPEMKMIHDHRHAEAIKGSPGMQLIYGGEKHGQDCNLGSANLHINVEFFTAH